MFQSSTDRVVKSVVDSFEFDKVSDLTKEQFTELLSQSIHQAINNSDYFREIRDKLEFLSRQARFAKGIKD